MTQYHAVSDGLCSQYGWAFTWPKSIAQKIVDAMSPSVNGRLVKFDPNREELRGRTSVRHYNAKMEFRDQSLKRDLKPGEVGYGKWRFPASDKTDDH